MDLSALRSFVMVADQSSFSRAADLLMIAQPAVSQQVKRLERELDVQLLRRSTRRVGLTAAGQAFLPRARAILAEVERAEQEMRLLTAGLAGRVAVGFVGTATYDLLPRVSRAVRAQRPAVRLELFGEQLSPGLEVDLLERRVDVAVLRDPSRDPALRIVPLRSERLVAALPVDHALADREQVTVRDLAAEVFVTHPSGHRSVMYDAVIQVCRSVGFQPEEVVEVRETATLVAFVAAGIGVALVPEPVRSLALEGVVYRPLADVRFETELVLATRADERSATVAGVVAAARAAARRGVGESGLGE